MILLLLSLELSVKFIRFIVAHISLRNYEHLITKWMRNNKLKGEITESRYNAQSVAESRLTFSSVTASLFRK